MRASHDFPSPYFIANQHFNSTINKIINPFEEYIIYSTNFGAHHNNLNLLYIRYIVSECKQDSIFVSSA